MSASGRAGNGRGNSRRRPFRRREGGSDTRPEWDEKSAHGSQGYGQSHGNGDSSRVSQKPQERRNRPRWQDENQSRGGRPPFVERPKWVPPKMNTDPLPVPDCPFCAKPIRDLSQAIADRDTGVPVHFDCVASRIAGGEKLEKDDTITYIGAGRFGIVCFTNRTEFKIKKVIEWENKDKKAEWRYEIREHYSVT